MKFNVAFGLAAALTLASNAVALNLFGTQQDATPATGAQPSGTVPSGLPQGSGSGSEGGFGGGAQESGRPHGSGTVPSGVAGGAQPSGGFSHGGHHGHHGHHGGFPSVGAQPSGSFGGFGQGGESGAAPTAVPSGPFSGSSGQETGFITVSGALPTGSAVPEADSPSEGNQSFERIHARQIRPFAI